MYSHFVVHVPHSSIEIPAPSRAGIVLPDDALRREIARMTDAYCDELFAFPEASASVVAGVSRLVCDVERFREDENEPCARLGQGAVYVRTSTGRRLRAYDVGLREQTLACFYDPHHARLTQAVQEALAAAGRCTILDGHSFHAHFPIRWDCLLRRPDVDVGTDPYHTPAGLRDALIGVCRAEGYTVRVNTPYAGAITPLCYYGKDRRVSSVMIELNRRLYMDGRTMEKTAGFAATRALCQKLLRAAAEWQGGIK